MCFNRYSINTSKARNINPHILHVQTCLPKHIGNQVCHLKRSPFQTLQGSAISRVYAQQVFVQQLFYLMELQRITSPELVSECKINSAV